MKTDEALKTRNRSAQTGAQTKDLLEIEKAGFRWAVRCYAHYLASEDLEFFALQYKPFYESMQEMPQGKGSVANFDPFAQHKHCKILFGIAFSQHGALMVSPPEYPTGKVPDLRFAAFERGVIKSLRNLWKLDRDGNLSLK